MSELELSCKGSSKSSSGDIYRWPIFVFEIPSSVWEESAIKDDLRSVVTDLKLAQQRKSAPSFLENLPHSFL